MAVANKKATLYLDPFIHKALRLKSAETSQSMSELVNQALKQALAEDAEDLAAFKDRAKEKLVSFEDMLKDLKRDGRI